jgi:amino acid transporter
MQSSTLAYSSARATDSLFMRIRLKLFGARRNPFDPNIFRHISLIAFFAWVGMGSDGITSANYGPEEAFRALHGYSFMAPLLAVVLAVTVLIISASYVQIIEQFPSGGGGYLVASKLLNANAGVVSGSALVIDYVLTVAVSVVAGVDALGSLSTIPWSSSFKVTIAIVVIFILMYMNLRGIKESVIALLPIFLVFVITHAFFVSYGFVTHIQDVPLRAVSGLHEASSALHKDGFFVLLFVFLNAFSMGAGTFTGIEAVSNGMPVLREPKVHTGKKTMVYMALSLSFLAGALLVNFFLFQSVPSPDKTLNSVLFTEIASGWKIAGLNIGFPLIWITLVSAALLLFVAAQTGFIDGPRVIANMAQDSWLPHRFSHLSERLVTRNGILLMGMAAVVLIFYSHGNIAILITLYAINVFITFSMSQLGMLRLWLSRRKTHDRWLNKFIINGTGFAVCFTLLLIMIFIKFFKGGWLTLLITACLVGLCFLIRQHYQRVHAKVETLDAIFADLPFGEEQVTDQPLDPGEPTAVILVEKFGGTGVHVMLNVQRLFGFRFKQYLFLSVGAIDSGRFKGVDELTNLKKQIQTEADKYVTLARSYGLKATSVTSCAIDYVSEIENLCVKTSEIYSNTIFFTARLLFWNDTLWSRLLHNETPIAIQRRLMFHGFQVMVLPVRLR